MTDNPYAMWDEIGVIANTDTSDKPVTRAELQGLSLIMGSPSMGHRVHARSGVLGRVFERVLAVGPKLEELKTAGVVDATQAGRFRLVYVRAQTLASREGGALPSPDELAKDFEFLWSDAFDDDDWRNCRQEARAAFTSLRPASDPWLG